MAESLYSSPIAQMRKLLRKCGTGQWLRSDGALTTEVADAVVIRDVHHALRLCREHRLSSMEIVLKFEKDEYDVCLPMGDSINDSSAGRTDSLRS